MLERQLDNDDLGMTREGISSQVEATKKLLYFQNQQSECLEKAQKLKNGNASFVMKRISV